MSRIITSTLALILCLAAIGQTKSAKRGVCGDASPEDLAAFAPYINWYYDWGVEPPAESEGQLSGIEWVPMQWGGFDITKVDEIIARIPDSTKYLLGFNEPNFTSQANLTPAQAAALWPYIEQIAADKGLLIVSPATNWCGDCVEGVSNDPIDWLDKFIAACPTCHFDYIAIHNYNSYVSTLEWYVGKFKKYGKPIWLTEFASWDDPVDYSGVVEYMKAALPYLESDTMIFRYSWFATRVDSNHDIDLLGENGELSKLGKLYATFPFEGSSTEDIGPIAFLPAEKNINLPTSSVTMPGNTYDPNDDAITIEWSQLSGPSVATISNITIAKPTVSGLELGQYLFQMDVSANGKTDSAQITINVNVANIAKNKTVTVSSFQNGNPGGNAVDGNIDSRWSSLDSDPQWIKIDLEGTYHITGATIVWEAAYAKIYTIDVSDDGINWNNVYTTSSGVGGTSPYTIDATGRYIRMYSSQRNNQSQYWGNSIYEFEVYGSLVTTTNNLSDKNEITIYPNPANDACFITLKESNTTTRITVFDQTGKQILRQDFESGQILLKIELSQLNPGLYIVQVKNQQTASTYKVMKE